MATKPTEQFGVPTRKPQRQAISRSHDELAKKLALQILRAEIEGRTAFLDTEGAIAQELKASRTATREVIKTLSAKGLVEVRRKVGVRAKNRSEWHLLDPDLLLWHCEAGLTDLFVRNLHELRLCIEPMAARGAAERGGERDFALITRSYRRMESSAADPDAFVQADTEFHADIFRACHNDLLEQLNRTVRRTLQVLHDMVKISGGGPEVALPLHKTVLDAILLRDGEKAQLAMEEVVNTATRAVYAVLHHEVEGARFVSDRKVADSPAVPKLVWHGHSKDK